MTLPRLVARAAGIALLGFGISTTQAFAAEGARVAILDRSAEALQKVEASVKDAGGEVHYRCLDAASPGGAQLKHVLQAGLVSDPPETVNTRPADPSRGTWYRVL